MTPEQRLNTMTPEQRLQIRDVGRQIGDLLNAGELDINAQLVVLFEMLFRALSSMSSLECAECRRTQVDVLRMHLPEMIAIAEVEQPTGDAHVHSLGDLYHSLYPNS